MSSTKPSTKPTPTTAPLKPCYICSGESCVVIPSIASPQHLCLLHYYTTGTHRSHPQSTTAARSIAAKKKSSSLLIESQRMDRQLPNVQELFAEAFVDLQKEIGEESARVFQSAANAEDPLALLLDSTASTASRSAISRSFRKQIPSKSRNNLSNTQKSTKQTTRQGEIDSEGGFIREAVLPKRLRKLQNPSASLDSFSSKYSRDSTTMLRKRSIARSSTTMKKPSTNPYQRQQKPPTNIWNQILDSNDGMRNNNTKKAKTKWADMEREMINNITSGDNASSKTCTCGSTNVEISGNVTSRNNDMTKGEVWGMKDRAEMVVERCHCLACGKTWNEE